MEEKAVTAYQSNIANLYAQLKRELWGRPIDLSSVEKAFNFAFEKHKNQKRASGEHYIVHPLEVARITSKLYLDEKSLIAALLHDVVEDTQCSIEEIHSEFGEEVASLVSGLTKISQVEYKSREEKQADNFRKMIIAMAKDIRVILIKLADRLHNMRTIDYLPEEKRKRIAGETLDIYAPIAHRLGIYWLKSELEDLSFKALYPDDFLEISQRVQKSIERKQEVIKFLENTIKEDMEENGIKCEVNGRVKHIYSIYKKMQVKGVDFDGIYDLVALRIITKTVKDCYAALGILHSKYKPIPGRFKDYIAIPKQNMYQSLHTTVFGPNNFIIEIQIRTKRMHEIAEEGVAAHYKYKENKPFDSSDRQFIWLRRLLEWHNELKNPREFLNTIKVDLFSGEVYVFTPRGDLKVLPRGATPVDFAYSIHTEIGNRCVGAKVNGKMVPLKYQLSSGDVVEIFTQANHIPSRDWLNFVVSSKAKSKIRQQVREREKQEAVEIGRNLLIKALSKSNKTLQSFLKEEKLPEVLSYFGLSKTEDMFEKIGFGKINPLSVISRIYPSEKKQLKVTPKENIYKVSVDGIDNISIRIAGCCKPVFGDEIVGYVTRTRGIVIHRKDCENIKRLGENTERLVDVEWEGEKFNIPCELKVLTNDKIGMLAYVTNAISKYNINTKTFSMEHVGENGEQVLLSFTLELPDRGSIMSLVDKLKKNRDIIKVEKILIDGR